MSKHALILVYVKIQIMLPNVPFHIRCRSAFKEKADIGG